MINNTSYAKALPNLSYQGLNDPSETMVPEASNRYGRSDNYASMEGKQENGRSEMVKDD